MAAPRWVLVLVLLCAWRAEADPGPPPAGYTLTPVSDGVSGEFLSFVTQLAFKPGDPAHVYAASGTYTVTLLASNDYGDTEFTLEVTVYDPSWLFMPVARKDS